MMSISVPMALAQDANLVLVIAATLSGGVFGDHCSPISDTTIISSMASACDHIDHVRTQLPYALLAGVISIVLFLIMGYAIP
jgi:Na+/H+ antiporter NhaC